MTQEIPKLIGTIGDGARRWCRGARCQVRAPIRFDSARRGRGPGLPPLVKRPFVRRRGPQYEINAPANSMEGRARASARNHPGAWRHPIEGGEKDGMLES